MKKYFNSSLLLIIIASSIILTSCVSNTNNNNKTGEPPIQLVPDTDETITDVDYDPVVDENDFDLEEEYNDTAIIITLFDNNSTSSTTNNVTIDNTTNIITINSSGTYLISGSLTDGSIIVKKDLETHLIFNGVAITSSTSAAVYIKGKSSKCVITLSKNTVNTFTDAANYMLEDGEDEPNACIFAKNDLTINGSGTLNVISKSVNGIQSKGGLLIIDGMINVNSYGNGLKGKNYVAIKGGEINITTTGTGDGIDASGSDGPESGFALIEDGNLTIQSADNAIQAVTAIKINGGIIKINSTNNGLRSYLYVIINDGNIEIVCGGDAIKAESEDEVLGSVYIHQGVLTIEAEEDGIQATSELAIYGGDLDITTTGNINKNTDLSSKGIKATNKLLVKEGTITINSTDHAVHCKNTIIISGGNFTINSTYGKGISAHGDLTVNDGIINIIKSTEGIESKAILTISGATTTIVASDDGLNAGGGDTIYSPGRPSNPEYDKHQIIINGGNLYITAGGDGIDSNGHLFIHGGLIIINGPTAEADGAIDADGNIAITGGTLIAVGSSGMAEAPGSYSTQYSFKYSFSSNITAGTLISVLDSKGNVMMAFTTKKSIKSLIFSSPDLQKGSTYKIYTGGSYSGGTENNGLYTGGAYTIGSLVANITLNNITTNAGSGRK